MKKSEIILTCLLAASIAGNIYQFNLAKTNEESNKKALLEVQSKIETLTEQNSSFQNELSEMKTKNENLEKEKTEFSKKIEQLNADLEQAKTEKEAAEQAAQAAEDAKKAAEQQAAAAKQTQTQQTATTQQNQSQQQTQTSTSNGVVPPHLRPKPERPGGGERPSGIGAPGEAPTDHHYNSSIKLQ